MDIEDLLKMKKSDYMNEKQLNFFKQILLLQKKEIVTIVYNIKKDLSKSERNADLNDIASSQEIQQIYLRNIDRQSKLLYKVNKALIRISKKEYGYCKVTGEPIGLKRLLARPTATLSIEAKEIQEHQEKTQGTIKN